MKTLQIFSIMYLLFGYYLVAEEIIGYALPYRQIDVAFPQDGILVELHVKEGDRVAKNQVLARLDTEIYYAGLKTAMARAKNKGILTARKVELQMHQNRLHQLLQLQKTQQVREAEMERIKADVAIAEAELLTVQEQQSIYALEVEKIKKEIEQRILKSPISGIVRKIYREAGENISRSQSEVMQIVDIQQLFVEIYVPLEKIKSLEIHQKIKINFTQLSLQATGSLEFIDPMADAASATVRLKILVPNPQENVPSGSRCQVNLEEKKISR